MADIFISYKREDNMLAAALAQELVKEGWTVWWDHELVSGKDYDISIENELQQARCVIVLWSALSILSRNVKDEANVALAANKLIPVMLGNVVPPLGFRMVQGVKWNENNKIEQNELDALKKQVQIMLNMPPAQAFTTSKKAATRSFKKGWLIAAGIIGVIFLYYLFAGGKDVPAKQPQVIDILTAQDHIEMGGTLLANTKDYDGAIQHFSKAIELDSTQAYAYYGRGTAYNLKGLQRRAIEDLVKSIELNYLHAWGNLGWVYFDLGDNVKALESFNEHARLAPDALSEAGAAMAWYLMDNTDSARTRYNQAIAIDRRFDGKFDILSNIYAFNHRQMETLKTTYADFKLKR